MLAFHIRSCKANHWVFFQFSPGKSSYPNFIYIYFSEITFSEFVSTKRQISDTRFEKKNRELSSTA